MGHDSSQGLSHWLVLVVTVADGARPCYLARCGLIAFCFCAFCAFCNLILEFGLLCTNLFGGFGHGDFSRGGFGGLVVVFGAFGVRRTRRFWRFLLGCFWSLWLFDRGLHRRGGCGGGAWLVVVVVVLVRGWCWCVVGGGSGCGGCGGVGSMLVTWAPVGWQNLSTRSCRTQRL